MLPSANPSVIFQKLDEGAVLFAPETELYFGLNDVGALVWAHLPPRSATLDALCDAIAAQYPDVPLTTIRTDVSELLEQLVAEGLACSADPRRADAAPIS